MTTYYVSRQSGADDNNSGTSTTSPWYSLSKVNNFAFLPGDVIRFRRGDTWYGQLRCNRDGNSSARITYSDYGSGNKPIIDGSNYGDCIDMTASYVTVENFYLRDSYNNGIIMRSGEQYHTVRSCEITNVGVGVYMSGNYGVVEYCYIHHTLMKVSTAGGDDDGGANPVQIFRSYNTVRYNDFRYNIGDSQDYGWDGGFVEIFAQEDLYGTRVHHNYGEENYHVLEVGGSNGSGQYYLVQDTLVYYNVLVNNHGRLFTCHITDTYQYSIDLVDFKVYNNTIIENGNESYLTSDTTSNSIWVRGSTNGELKLRNNIIYKTYGTIDDEGQIHEYNCYYGGIAVNTGYGTGEFNSDPLFVDYGSGDYHLQSGSPCRNTGTELGLSPDYVGVIVPQGGTTDIGAYEYYEGGGGEPGTIYAYVGELTATGEQGDALESVVQNYTINDEFTTDDAYPDTPRECEPGPGIAYLTYTSAEQDMVITGHRLRMIGNEGAWDTLGAIFEPTVSRVNGRSSQVDFELNSGNQWLFGMHDGRSFPGFPTGYTHAIVQDTDSTQLENRDGAIINTGMTAGAPYTAMIILGTTRTKYMLWDGTQWTLMWTSYQTLSGLFTHLVSNEADIYFNDVRSFLQEAPYTTDRGLADTSIQNPSTGTNFYHNSGGILVEFWADTLPASGLAINVAVKRASNDYLWYIEIGSSGGVRLKERRAGVDTYYITGGTAVAGDRIVLKVDGNTFRLYVNNTLVGTHTSDGFLADEDGGRYGGFTGNDGGSISHLIVWPLHPTGSDAPILTQDFPQTVAGNVGALTIDTPQGDAFELNQPRRVYANTRNMRARGWAALVYETPGPIIAAVGEITAGAESATATPGAATIQAVGNFLHMLPGTQATVAPTNTILAAVAALSATPPASRVTSLLIISAAVAELSASGETPIMEADRIIVSDDGKILTGVADGENFHLQMAGLHAEAAINAKQRLNPWSVAHLGDWVTHDRQTIGLWEQLDEFTPDDTDYIKSDADPSSSPVVFKLEKAFDPGTHNNHVLQYRYSREGLDAGDITVELREGYVDETTQGTLIASWSHTGVGTTVVSAYQLLTTTQAGNITDYTDLYVRIVATL